MSVEEPKKKGSKLAVLVEHAVESPPEEFNDIDPLNVFLDNMRTAFREAKQVERKIEGLRDPKEIADNKCNMWRLRNIAQEAATYAAPYLHSRRATVEHTGVDGAALTPPQLSIVMVGNQTEQAPEPAKGQLVEGSAVEILSTEPLPVTEGKISLSSLLRSVPKQPSIEKVSDSDNQRGGK